MAGMDRSVDGTERRLRPPSLFLMLAEARGVLELNSSLLLSPLLMRAPRGDGHPVLALPGFLASDLSMAPMRRYLKELGYDAYAWNMGRNFGGISSRRAALRDLLKRVHEASGRKVSIIGWSLGGVYARDLASQMPELVRSIVTLGSPRVRCRKSSPLRSRGIPAKFRRAGPCRLTTPERGEKRAGRGRRLGGAGGIQLRIRSAPSSRTGAPGTRCWRAGVGERSPAKHIAPPAT